MTLRVVLALLLALIARPLGKEQLPTANRVWSRLPHHIKIGKKDYPIRYVLHPNGRKDLLGITVYTNDPNTDPKHNYIEVAVPEPSYDELESTIIHEILHALAAEYKFKLSEKKVLELERALFATLKQNGWQIQVK